MNTRDEWHEKAVMWQVRVVSEMRTLLTSEFVLVEIANGLAALHHRNRAVQAIATLRASDYVEIVPASTRLFDDSFSLYREREDKNWGMTDCASFVIMRERGLTDALTMDRHFQQAGFHALLLE